MKVLLSLGAFVLLLAQITIGGALKFLILRKIGATEIMWMLFIMELPMIVLLQVLAEIIKKLKDD